jgi:uncharacterized phage-associated protein
MRFPFNERKAAQAAAYLLKKHGGRLNYMKLIKLLYLADRMALVKRGYPITGDRMVSMPKGPVLSNILDLINWGQKREENSTWLEYISAPEGYEVRVANTSLDYDELSEGDRQILDEIDAEYGKIDQWSLVDLTHELPEWQDPRGSSIPLDPAEILRAVGRSEREIQVVAENAEQALLIQNLGRVELRLEK